MAVNLIGGWFQRLDGTGGRKVAFGNVHVFGQEPDLEIAGVFLVQGTDIPAAFKEVMIALLLPVCVAAGNVPSGHQAQRQVSLIVYH